MENQFVPCGLAIKLKELRFNEPCIAYYTNHGIVYDVYTVSNFSGRNVLTGKAISTPLWQQAFDWFREKHNLHCVIDEYENPKSWGYLINNDDLDEAFNFNSYEEARLECLKKLIELCEKD